MNLIYIAWYNDRSLSYNSVTITIRVTSREKLLQNNNTVYTDRCRVFRGLSSAAKLAERYEPETLVVPKERDDSG